MIKRLDMYGKCGINIALVMVIITLTVNAEEKTGEIFAWFPSGSYVFLVHYDMVEAMQGKGWETRCKLYENYRGPDPEGWLPQSFKGHWKSYTKAQPLKIKINRQIMGNLTLDNGPELFKVNRTFMNVYRYEWLQPIIKEAEDAGEISSTGIIFMGQQIYTYLGTNYRGERTKMYAAATFSQEWVVAEDMNSLKLMLATGMGRHASILEDEEMEVIAEVLPDLGESWVISLVEPISRMQREAYRRNGTPEEYIREWEQEDPKQPLFIFNTTYYKDKYIEKVIKWYTSEEYAQAASQQVGEARPTRDESEKKYWDILAKKKETEVEDNMIITTIEYDAELLASEIEYAKWEMQNKSIKEKK
jgi:hypothetical protein